MKICIVDYVQSYESDLFEIYNKSKIQEFIKYPEIISVPRIQDDPEALKSFHKAQKIIACIDTIPIGFAGSKGNFISHLYVLPEYRNRGIGTSLLSEMLKTYEVDRFLFTTSGNMPAIRLYRRFGFRISEVMNYTYHNNEIQIVKMQEYMKSK